ncbi:hypothetical protein [Streptomyces aureocirculatus]|uniref:hypothetical protein n=1 Tax=Streptomyces aureocirculatus TaxID=67275 RepID=UPI0004CC4BBF|nr:hypothetical protein [Streptomyces aureocirculatus]
MDAELAALAAAGATALVQSMVGDGWTAARERVVGFFSRRGAAGAAGGEDAIAGELDEAREELVAARDADDPDAAAAAADVQAEWRNQLRRTLRADPEAAAELRALLAELAPADGAEGPGGVVHNSISGGVQHGNVIQAHTVGDVRLG